MKIQSKISNLEDISRKIIANLILLKKIPKFIFKANISLQKYDLKKFPIVYLQNTKML